VLPWFFERVATPANREVFILAVGAFAMGAAYLSTLFGLSLALGAFVAGVVVSESDLWHQILGEVMPLRDIFAALFFVSVGMLVDPGFIVRNLPLVLVALLMIVVVKGLLVTGISLVFRYPFRIAALTGVTLAQSAEFSFLLARLGADLGAIGPEVFNLILAGAAISIVISPSLHHLAQPVVDRIERILPESELSRLPDLEDPAGQMRGHAVICGYGRVGRIVGEAMRRRGLPFIVIEQDREIVRRLRDEGVPTLFGTADNPVLLERAHVERARVLVVAVPDAVSTRRVVEHAQRTNPRIEIVARTHNPDESAFLRNRGVTEAVFGELELALELTRFALHRFGVGTLESQALLQRLRVTGEWQSGSDDGSRPARSEPSRRPRQRHK
jgi:monovalent cation:H+ antiporter-2, CPA2 family